jgi:predicted N-acyltransferase
MSVEIAVHRSFDAVPAADWNRLAQARSAFQDLDWYRSAPSIGSLRFFVAREDGRLRAILPMYLLDAPGHYYHTPRELFCGFRERALLGRAAGAEAAFERAAAARWFPALVSISPYGYRGGLIAEPATAPAVVDAIVASIRDLCVREDVALVAYHYLNQDDDEQLLEALASRGARSVVAGADCNLDLCWSSLDAYFDDLGGRRRRVRAEYRAAMRRPARWRRRELDGKGVTTDVAEELLRLFAATALRHGDATPAERLHPKLLQCADGGRFVLTGENGARVRSALLVLAKAGVWYPKLFGSDVRDDYFFLTFSGLVAEAIGRGVRRIEFGGGSHRAKLLRGARLRWLYAALDVVDEQLAAALREFLPIYASAKTAHFAELSRRYDVDHAVPVPSSFGALAMQH